MLGSGEGHELDGLCCSIHCALQPYRRFWCLEDNNNLTTFSQLASAAGTPQAPLNDEAFKEFGNQLNAGHDLTIARLHFETQTWVVAHLKVSADATDTIKKLPLAEKETRLEDQRVRLAEFSFAASCNRHLL